MYYDSLQRHKKQIIVGIVLLFATIIVWATIVLVGRVGKLPVVVSVVPSNASVSFDDDSYGKGTQWLEPGTYTVSVKKDGFKSTRKTVTITDKKSQNVVAVSLEPESDEAKKWAEKHSRDYSNNEQYGAIEASESGKYFSEKHPITTKLPFKDPYFTLGYTVGDNDSITLTIDTPSPRYRFYAIEKIRQLGFDPTDYQITFKDFRNPLGEK